MIFVRLLTVFLSALLLSAHLLRFHGLYPALLPLLLLLLFIIRRQWVLRLWQLILFAGTLLWIQVAVQLVQIRIGMGLPWIRLAVIMAAVILWTIFSGFWLENSRVKKFYHPD
ncbi:MAG: hypothetical protein WAN36_07420 [Calditrichia bacterium]